MHATTYDSRDFELRESFRVRVWEVNDPQSEVIVEVRIVDKDAPLYEFAEVEYLYDHQNQMVGRVFDVDGEGEEDPTYTFFSYQDGQVVLQFAGSEDTDLAHRYFWNPTAIDQLLADEQVADDLVLWALTDQQGTVRDPATHNSTTHATTVVLHRNYGAYGNVVGASGSLLDGYADEGSNRLTTAASDALFNYTGRFFDTSTWLQYNLNRWYDAQTGRWISEDPIGFSGDPWNLYRYVGNSPTNATDSTGLKKRSYDIFEMVREPPNRADTVIATVEVEVSVDKAKCRDGKIPVTVSFKWNAVTAGSQHLIGQGEGRNPFPTWHGDLWFRGRHSPLTWRGRVRPNGEREVAGSSVSGSIEVGTVDADGGTFSGTVYALGAPLTFAQIEEIIRENGGFDRAMPTLAQFSIPFTVRMKKGCSCNDASVEFDDVSLQGNANVWDRPTRMEERVRERR
jgi:RHS repeat-associated protein